MRALATALSGQKDGIEAYTLSIARTSVPAATFAGIVVAGTKDLGLRMGGAGDEGEQQTGDDQPAHFVIFIVAPLGSTTDSVWLR